MDRLNLKADKRTIAGRKVKKLRLQGLLPANLYGKKIKSQAVQVQVKDFHTVFTKAGETTLINLSLNGNAQPVLIHNVQYHPVTHNALHADFYQVDLKEKVTTKVPVNIIGEAQAVKDKIGVLLNILSEIEVEALPTDLPDKIEIDVTHLKAVAEAVKISDIKISEKVKILSDSQQEVVKIAPLISKEAEKMTEEQIASEQAAQAAAEAAAPEAKTETASPTEEKATSPEAEVTKTTK